MEGLRVTPAAGGDLASVQTLWREYWVEMGLANDFQDFAREVAALPGPYRLLLATVNGEAAGTIALRRHGPHSCEAKRLYVRPAWRGRGIAAQLLRNLMELARAEGYTEMFGDTLPAMTTALAMYRALGFRETDPYSDRPTPGAVYLRLAL